MTLPNGAAVDIATIPFHGTDILAALIDGKEHIVLRPAIEPFGLDYSSQLRKLKAKSWACVVNLTMQLPGDTQAREHAAVDVRTFLMLLATINEKQVAESVRDLLVKFQSEIADVIEAYFTKGAATNPRFDVLPEPSPVVEIATAQTIARAEEAVAIVRMLGVGVEVGLIDRTWASGKAMLRVARVLDEEPEQPDEDKPLYIPDFLKTKGITAKKDVASIQSWFGRRAVEIGEANGVDIPELRQTELPNGSIRDTRAWCRKHKPLFDEVWTTYYAAKYDPPMGQLELGAA